MVSFDIITKSPFLRLPLLQSWILSNNDLVGYGDGTKVAAKATSATSAVYSSTANYAKNAPQYKGATTAAAGTKGLVPAATTATRLKFLRGDGTWSTPHEGTATYAGSAAKATSATSATYSSTANYAKAIPNYKGATTAASGTAGAVPAATTATKDSFLRGDGKWATPSKATSATSATYAATANYAKKSNISMSLSGTVLTITYS